METNMTEFEKILQIFRNNPNFEVSNVTEKDDYITAYCGGNTSSGFGFDTDVKWWPETRILEMKVNAYGGKTQMFLFRDTAKEAEVVANEMEKSWKYYGVTVDCFEQFMLDTVAAAAFSAIEEFFSDLNVSIYEFV